MKAVNGLGSSSYRCNRTCHVRHSLKWKSSRTILVLHVSHSKWKSAWQLCSEHVVYISVALVINCKWQMQRRSFPCTAPGDLGFGVESEAGNECRMYSWLYIITYIIYCTFGNATYWPKYVLNNTITLRHISWLKQWFICYKTFHSKARCELLCCRKFLVPLYISFTSASTKI